MNGQISDLQKQVDEGEAALSEEKSSHDMTREEVEALRRQLDEMKTELENIQTEADAKLEGVTNQKQHEIDTLTLVNIYSNFTRVL